MKYIRHKLSSLVQK